MGKKGFTIVELLVVIVVIGVLAAITVVSYTGISQKAIAASLMSDLDNVSRKIKLFQVENGAYPDRIDDCSSPASTNLCITSSSGNSLLYNVNNTNNPQTFGLSATNGSLTYRITSDSIPIACPVGYIVVPASPTYGTNNFCVMKYEAKNISGVATSQASTDPWVSISQTNAISTSSAACSGCRLISEAEWLTIAQNVLSVPSNWSGNAVGNGYIYSGHNDGSPANHLPASTDDNNGYFGTGDVANAQRRTLKLTNGEVIWDFAGNDYEWTSGQITTGKPGVTGAGGNWRSWPAITNIGTIAPSPFPGATGLPGSSSWSNSQGIGSLYSNADDTSLKGLFRSGYWGDTSNVGVLTLVMADSPTDTRPTLGFRVTR